MTTMLGEIAWNLRETWARFAETYNLFSVNMFNEISIKHFTEFHNIFFSVICIFCPEIGKFKKYLGTQKHSKFLQMFIYYAEGLNL